MANPEPPFRSIPSEAAGTAPTQDAIVERVRKKLADRSAAGIVKYGKTMERTDLNRLDWLRHAQEELLDGAVYLERLIQDEEAGAAPMSGRVHWLWQAAVWAVVLFLLLFGIWHGCGWHVVNPTQDELYGCTAEDAAPNGECQ